MKKNVIKCISAILIIFMAIISCDNESSTQKIALAQYIDHPGLNAARDGFNDRINEWLRTRKDSLEIDYYNSYGDNSMMQTIINDIYSKDYQLIITLATPISQAAKTKFLDKNVPMIYGVITDPVSAGLIQSMQKPGDNNTASSDQWPYYEQIKLIKDYFSNFKKIGVPFNPGEVNTQYAMKQIRDAANNLGIELVEKPLYNLNDVSTVINSFGNSVDAIFIPADNTAMAAAPTIILVAKRNNLPVIAGDPGTFNAGAIIGLGVSYYDLGTQTAEMAIKILNGANAGSLPVAVVKNPELMINLEVAKELGVTIPNNLIEKADTVIH